MSGTRKSARPVSDAEVVALALRELSAGLDRALAILEARGPASTDAERRAAFADFAGLSHAEVLQRMRAHGMDPRGYGGMLRHGYVTARADGLYDGNPAGEKTA